jgi:hypothetical protein
MSQEREWNAQVIAEFRANSGQVASPYDDPPPMVLLHTIGARTGQEHIVPMRAMPSGDAPPDDGSAPSPRAATGGALDFNRALTCVGARLS